MKGKGTELLARLDDAIEDRSLLNHPFYEAWQAGRLSREKLQLYAAPRSLQLMLKLQF